MLRLWLLPKYQTHTYLIISFNINKVKVQAKKGKLNDDLENITFKGLFTALLSLISNLLFNFYSPNPLWCIFKSNAHHIFFLFYVKAQNIFLKNMLTWLCSMCALTCIICSSSFISERRFADYIWRKKKPIIIKRENRLSVNNYLIPNKMFTKMILSVTH